MPECVQIYMSTNWNKISMMETLTEDFNKMRGDVHEIHVQIHQIGSTLDLILKKINNLERTGVRSGSVPSQLSAASMVTPSTMSATPLSGGSGLTDSSLSFATVSSSSTIQEKFAHDKVYISEINPRSTSGGPRTSYWIDPNKPYLAHKASAATVSKQESPLPVTQLFTSTPDKHEHFLDPTITAEQQFIPNTDTSADTAKIGTQETVQPAPLPAADKTTTPNRAGTKKIGARQQVFTAARQKSKPVSTPTRFPKIPPPATITAPTTDTTIAAGRTKKATTVPAPIRKIDREPLLQRNLQHRLEQIRATRGLQSPPHTQSHSAQYSKNILRSSAEQGQKKPAGTHADSVHTGRGRGDMTMSQTHRSTAQAPVPAPKLDVSRKATGTIASPRNSARGNAGQGGGAKEVLALLQSPVSGARMRRRIAAAARAAATTTTDTSTSTATAAGTGPTEEAKGGESEDTPLTAAPQPSPPAAAQTDNEVFILASTSTSGDIENTTNTTTTTTTPRHRVFQGAHIVTTAHSPTAAAGGTWRGGVRTTLPPRSPTFQPSPRAETALSPSLLPAPNRGAGTTPRAGPFTAPSPSQLPMPTFTSPAAALYSPDREQGELDMGVLLWAQSVAAAAASEAAPFVGSPGRSPSSRSRSNSDRGLQSYESHPHRAEQTLGERGLVDHPPPPPPTPATGFTHNPGFPPAAPETDTRTGGKAITPRCRSVSFTQPETAAGSTMSVEDLINDEQESTQHVRRRYRGTPMPTIAAHRGSSGSSTGSGGSKETSTFTVGDNGEEIAVHLGFSDSDSSSSEGEGEQGGDATTTAGISTATNPTAVEAMGLYEVVPLEEEAQWELPDTTTRVLPTIAIIEGYGAESDDRCEITDMLDEDSEAVQGTETERAGWSREELAEARAMELLQQHIQEEQQEQQQDGQVQGQEGAQDEDSYLLE